MRPRSIPTILLVSLLTIPTALLSSACMKQVERTIPRDKVGTKYARLSGYFGTSGAAPGGRHEEGTPGQIRHERIRDEATLMRMDAGETCFAVIIRTESQHDEPLEQLAPTCKTDGGNSGAIVENERLRVVDYGYQGMAPVVQAEGVAAESYMGMAISKPADKIFRAVAGTRKAELHMINERWTSYTSPNRIEFVWNLN